MQPLESGRTPLRDIPFLAFFNLSLDYTTGAASQRREEAALVAGFAPESPASGVFMRYRNGFSLIELLLVVTVILIISAIAVPNFLRSRQRANEASAVASIRVVNTAAVTYSMTYPDLGYPAQLTTLGGANPCTASSTQACLMDDLLAQGVKNGYSFVLTGDGVVPSVGYAITATPQVVGSSGQRMFCTDQTGVVRFDPSGSGCSSASAALD
jgi:prepilin-type N-terminal cleavage/methylation domain-containing protein